MRVKIRTAVNCIGIEVGREAEVDLDDKVIALAKAGYLQLLRPSDGNHVPE